MTLHRIVLTGGPCGGKTTAMTKLTERLQGFGFRVIVVPEVATAVFGGGITLANCTEQQVAQIEVAMLRLQMSLEDQFIHAAEAHTMPTVLLFDRGCLDYKAYMPEPMWQGILDALGGLSEVDLRDGRYDAVIHMVTAADGAAEFYSLDNNAIRTETPERAVELDGGLQRVWTGHPHLRVIDNSTDFEGKVQRAIQAVCRVTGVPEPLEIEKKYRLKKSGLQFMSFPSTKVEIEQMYLLDQSRIRRRGVEGYYAAGVWVPQPAWVYTRTVKRERPEGGRYETEERITAWEYKEMSMQRDKSRAVIKKTRTCFLDGGRYFELDEFHAPHWIKGVLLLELELDHDDQSATVDIPSYLEVTDDVTEDSEWSNFALAGGPPGQMSF